MIDETDWSRLARFVAGECSIDEAEEIRRWIASDPERQAAVAFMREVDQVADTTRPQWDTVGSWKRLAARKSARAQRRLSLLAVVPWKRQPQARRSAHTRRRSMLSHAAAAVLIVFAASSLAIWARTRTPAATVVHQVAFRTVTTTNGQIASLTLADGSTVALGPASQLRYPPAGAAGPRDVYLDGEAYFEVVHDPERPFVVHTSNGVIEDLGTKFGVHAYATDTTVRVVVADGSVELRAKSLPMGSRGAVLTAGQSGQLARNGSTLVQPDVNVGRALAWVRGRLVFDDTPLGEAIPDLERWYDIDVRLADPSLAHRHLSGSYQDEPVTEVLENIALALGLRVEHSGRTITLAADRGSQVPRAR